MDDGRVYAEAGVASPKVARFAARHDLAGAEFLAGHAGHRRRRARDERRLLRRRDLGHRRARASPSTGAAQLRTRARDEFEIGYRHCALKARRRVGDGDEWFAGAWFDLRPGDGEASRARIKELLAKRIATQPLQLPNAGTVFRNPPRATTRRA